MNKKIDYSDYGLDLKNIKPLNNNTTISKNHIIKADVVKRSISQSLPETLNLANNVEYQHKISKNNSEETQF